MLNFLFSAFRKASEDRKKSAEVRQEQPGYRYQDYAEVLEEIRRQELEPPYRYRTDQDNEDSG